MSVPLVVESDAAELPPEPPLLEPRSEEAPLPPEVEPPDPVLAPEAPLELFNPPVPPVGPVLELAGLLEPAVDVVLTSLDVLLCEPVPTLALDALDEPSVPGPTLLGLSFALHPAPPKATTPKVTTPNRTDSENALEPIRQNFDIH